MTILVDNQLSSKSYFLLKCYFIILAKSLLKVHKLCQVTYVHRIMNDLKKLYKKHQINLMC